MGHQGHRRGSGLGRKGLPVRQGRRRTTQRAADPALDGEPGPGGSAEPGGIHAASMLQEHDGLRHHAQARHSRRLRLLRHWRLDSPGRCLQRPRRRGAAT